MQSYYYVLMKSCILLQCICSTSQMVAHCLANYPHVCAIMQIMPDMITVWVSLLSLVSLLTYNHFFYVMQRHIPASNLLSPSSAKALARSRVSVTNAFNFFTSFALFVHHEYTSLGLSVPLRSCKAA